MSINSTIDQQVQRYFRGEEGYNCAQAVARIMQENVQEVQKISDEMISRMANCGGGRAPEGLCGALFGALEIVGEEGRRRLKDAFKEKIGSGYCREIRRNKMAPCRDCVAAAVDLLLT